MVSPLARVVQSCEHPALWLVIVLVAFGFWAAYWYKKVRQVFLTGERQKVTLIDKAQLTSNSFRLRFALDHQNQKLGLPVGQHLRFFVPNASGTIHEEWNGKPDRSFAETEIFRPYTPTSGDECKGFVDFVIKSYRPSNTFVDGGKCSQYLEKLEVDSQVTVKGPVGRIRYLGDAEFSKNNSLVPGGRKMKISMIAGGTGIAPMIQILKAVLHGTGSVEEKMEFAMIFANQTEDDILCRQVLEDFERENPKRFKLWYTVDKSKSLNWGYSTGYVTEEMMRERLFPSRDDTICLLCGPVAMTVSCKKMLVDSLGYVHHNIICF